MAQTHRDADAMTEEQIAFIRSLEAKAGQMMRHRESQITAGSEPIRAWQANGVDVRQLPDDEHGILRISIGGGTDTPIELNYCRFRGEHGKCVDLLRKALAAMEAGDDG